MKIAHFASAQSMCIGQSARCDFVSTQRELRLSDFMTESYCSAKNARYQVARR